MKETIFLFLAIYLFTGSLAKNTTANSTPYIVVLGIAQDAGYPQIGCDKECCRRARKDARLKKDYATSDKIRNQLHELGIELKDEKDGGVSYLFV